MSTTKKCFHSTSTSNTIQYNTIQEYSKRTNNQQKYLVIMPVSLIPSRRGAYARNKKDRRV